MFHHLQIHGKFEKCAVGHSGPKRWLNNHVTKKETALTVTTLFAQSLSQGIMRRILALVEGQAMELSLAKQFCQGSFSCTIISFQSPFLLPMSPQDQQEAP